MFKTIQELRKLVGEFRPRLQAIEESEFASKPLPGKWSRKEVLGHLIDSAHNNYRRFLCGQYDDPTLRITYDQDFWVKANGYQLMHSAAVIDLWTMMNEMIIRVLENMPGENYGKTANTGKESMELRSLEWLAIDYIKHMKHHLNQIFKGEFDIVYP